MDFHGFPGKKTLENWIIGKNIGKGSFLKSKAGFRRSRGGKNFVTEWLTAQRGCSSPAKGSPHQWQVQSSPGDQIPMTDPNGAAIYGVPWIPSIYPLYVSIYIYIYQHHGSVMGYDLIWLQVKILYLYGFSPPNELFMDLFMALGCGLGSQCLVGLRYWSNPFKKNTLVMTNIAMENGLFIDGFPQ